MTKKKLFFWLGIVLVSICVLYFGRQVAHLLATSGSDIRSSLSLLPPAICAYMAAYVAFGLGWHQLLLATGKNSGFAMDLGIFTTSQFAKYLPGNVGHHAGRVVLAKKFGHSAYSVVVTMFVELGMTLVAMLILSLPYLGYWSRKLAVDTAVIGYLAAALGLGLLVSLAMAVRFKQHPRLERLANAFHEISSRRAHSALRLSAAFALIILGIALTTASLGLLDSQSTLLSLPSFPILLGVFAASWIFGFLVPGAPAGIGVREMVLTEGLTPLIGRDHSILIALLFRILSTACDLLAFTLGSATLWLLARSKSPAGTSPLP